MFSMGMPEILIILAVALLVVGPKKLPDLAKGLGKGIREFRGAADELKAKFEETETYNDLKDIKGNLTDMAKTVNPKSYLDIEALDVDASSTSPKEPVQEAAPAATQDSAATEEIASSGQAAIEESAAEEPAAEPSAVEETAAKEPAPEQEPKRFMPPGAKSEPVPAETDNASDLQEKPASEKNE